MRLLVPLLEETLQPPVRDRPGDGRFERSTLSAPPLPPPPMPPPWAASRLFSRSLHDGRTLGGLPGACGGPGRRPGRAADAPAAGGPAGRMCSGCGCRRPGPRPCSAAPAVERSLRAVGEDQQAAASFERLRPAQASFEPPRPTRPCGPQNGSIGPAGAPPAAAGGDGAAASAAEPPPASRAVAALRQAACDLAAPLPPASLLPPQLVHLANFHLRVSGGC